MKRNLALAVSLVISTTAGLAQKPLVVGICPFSDDTATPAGERSGTMLPVIFLDRAKSAGFLPVIVNPGPDVSPGDTQSPAEVARTVGADAVLIGQVRAEATSKGKPGADLRGYSLLSSHAANLVFAATLVATADGRELGTVQATEPVKGSWLLEAAGYNAFGGPTTHYGPFTNTHLGQAIGHSADQFIAYIGQQLSQLQPSGAYTAVPAGGTCRVSIQVRYPKQKASKAYSIAVNGKDESLGVSDGKVELEEPSGPILLNISVQDAPYLQPVQNTYYANSMLDCSRDANTLLFEIGSAGEAVIRWK